MIFVPDNTTSPRLWQHARAMVEGRAGLGDALLWSLDTRGSGAGYFRGHRAEYLVDRMRTTGLDSALIVGHHLGSGVAQILAVHTPKLV